jgi:hypothetical protein
VDNETSFHLTGITELFTRLQVGGMNLVIELKDDKCYKAQGGWYNFVSERVG